MRTSSKVLIQDLNPEGETDFWKFYIKNRAVCDRVIKFQLRSLIKGEDTQADIGQEILMSLHRCNIIAGYDPTKNTTFSTYFTNTVRGHIRRQIPKLLHFPYHPFHTNKPEGEENNLRYKRVFYGVINKMRCIDKSFALSDIPVYEPESDLELIDTLKTIRSHLSGETLKVFNFIILEYTKADICEVLKVEYFCIKKHVKRIKDIAYKLSL